MVIAYPTFHKFLGLNIRLISMLCILAIMPKLMVTSFRGEDSDILAREQPTFGDATTGFPAKLRLRKERRNSMLMTRHYPDLGSASDWLNKFLTRYDQSEAVPRSR